MIIDTHTHLNSEDLYDGRDDFIARAKEKNIIAIVNNGDSYESLNVIFNLVKEHPNFCYSAFGIHPEHAKSYDREKLEEYILNKNQNLLAIGEIGLDYHYNPTEEDKVKQKEVFIDQIHLARKYNLPLIIHSRDADQQTFDILVSEAKDLKVDLHCYSGSSELALEYLKRIPNIYFGIGGVVTFKNAKKLVEVVEKVPLTHLLTETDAPYLTPEPNRGKPNESSYLPYVISRIALIKGLSNKEVEETTYKNACEFLKL